MAPEQSARQLPIILALGTTQTLAWASSYYLPAILADPIGRDLGVSSNWIFAAFSASLVISAVLGPRVGRQIDLVGGRSVLSISNLTLAAGLVLLGLTYSIPVLILAWLLLGVGMGFGLYDAAFAALDHRHHAAGRLRLHRGMAADGLGIGKHRLAQHLLRMGSRTYPDRPAAEFFHAAGCAGRQGGRCDIDKTSYPDRPDHGPAGVRLCGGVERHRRDGGASAANSRSGGRDNSAGGVGRRADRPGAGVCPHRRGEFPEPLPPAAVDTAGMSDASDRRRHRRARGRRGGERVRGLSWRRQRRPDHCARHAAAGDLRPAKLWLSARDRRRAGADGPGAGAIGVRFVDRHDGKPHPDRLLRP